MRSASIISSCRFIGVLPDGGGGTLVQASTALNAFCMLLTYRIYRLGALGWQVVTVTAKRYEGKSENRN
jgi:hypothetical protein